LSESKLNNEEEHKASSQNQQRKLRIEQRKWRKKKEEDEDSTKLHPQGTTENDYKDRNKLSLEGKSNTIL